MKIERYGCDVCKREIIIGERVYQLSSFKFGNDAAFTIEVRNDPVHICEDCINYMRKKEIIIR